MFKDKYLKYKIKYLNLIGGAQEQELRRKIATMFDKSNITDLPSTIKEKIITSFVVHTYYNNYYRQVKLKQGNWSI